ncbi:MAG: HAMP domain-containing protein [Pseudomonadota bacterium]|nr:HAMP domain-containing protein [Pseudomonadota bacterium]
MTAIGYTRGALHLGRDLWRSGARTLAGLFPKGLYARSLLIVILPMVLLQTGVAYLFMQRHWDLVTHRLSNAVARDVGAVVDLYQMLPLGADDKRLREIASERFRMSVDLMPPQPLPPRLPRRFFDFLDPLTRALPSELAHQLKFPIWVDTVGKSGLMEIRVDLGFGVARFITKRSLGYDANVHIFIFWMFGASVALIAVAILFLRNQIRPILRLAKAAEDFGKGRFHDYHPRGAREVRQAGLAFVEMKRRIERANEQRTAMLSGVSHDLRTILTRFRLSLAMFEPSAETQDLDKDIDEMQAMLEGYLAFARGDSGEAATPTDLSAMLDDMRLDAERHGAPVALVAKGGLTVTVRPMAIRRCLANLVGNAQRYGRRVEIAAAREGRFVLVHVDDDGPGVPAAAREDVFRPFFRLDEARNQDQSGSGLGLSIARDIARSHGGDVLLNDSPLGGLRATLRIPV